MVFLDKKQGWYHIVVPEEATQIVKMGKGKVGKLRGFKKDSCTAEECKRLQNHVIFGALVMLTNANSSDQDNNCLHNNNNNNNNNNNEDDGDIITK